MTLPTNNPVVQLIGRELSGLLYFLVIFLLVAGWFLIKRLPDLIRSMRGANWPIAEGKVETVGVEMFAEQSVAEIGYSYLVEGDRHAGYFKRQFAEEQEAWSYATPLKGQSVIVRYKAGAASVSALRLQDQSALFQSSRGSFTGGLFRVLFHTLKNSQRES